MFEIARWFILFFNLIDESKGIGQNVFLHSWLKKQYNYHELKNIIAKTAFQLCVGNPILNFDPDFLVFNSSCKILINKKIGIPTQSLNADFSIIQ